MGRAKIIAVDESGDEPLYTVELPDGSKRDGVTAADLEPAADEAEASPAPPAAIKFFQYELEGGVVTINELRASKGLPRDERFGDMTLPEYVAAKADTFNLFARARSTSPIDDGPRAGDEIPVGGA